ncbi:MAG TPA: class I SAM-dependent methyltransferase [Candidatus Sulfotelmatobacter sp.]|nr:class I SAM-dependent methyltransferase [Candidatus Sulfotelmatobacter sp.]
MLVNERSLWNKKYSERSHSSLEPDPLLLSAHQEFLSARSAGTALDVAGGVGRHAIWLASRGWSVKLLDVSEVGMKLAQENAARMLGPSGKESLVTTEAADLNQVRDLGGPYDLVLVFFYLQRQLFPALISSLKPGGFLIYKTYSTEQQRFSGGALKSGPSHPMFLLEPNELLRAFQPLRVLYYHETVVEKGVAELVALK